MTERCPVCGCMSLYPGLIHDVHVLNGSKWPDVIENMPFIISERLHSAWADAGLEGFTSRRIFAVPIPYGQEFIMKSYHGATASIPSECRIKTEKLPCYSISVPRMATVDPQKTMVRVIHCKNGEYVSESGPVPLCKVSGACHWCANIKDSEDSVSPESISLLEGQHHEKGDFYYWKSRVFISARVVEVCISIKATNFRWVKGDDALNTDAPCLERLP
jgi:hypothetical protein